MHSRTKAYEVLHRLLVYTYLLFLTDAATWTQNVVGPKVNASLDGATGKLHLIHLRFF